MRLNIAVTGEFRNGYVNVSPCGNGDVQCDHRNLDGVVEDCEATEIFAPHVLDQLHITELRGVLEHYVKKLRIGGKLVVGGTDVFELAKSYVLGNISIADFNACLFGGNDSLTQQHGQYTPMDVFNLLKSFGLEVTKNRANGRSFVVEGVRNG